MVPEQIITLFPPENRIDSSLLLPGSKSYTNRFLIMAALAEGESLLKGISPSDDSEVMLRALEKLGIGVIRSGQDLIVKGHGGQFVPFLGDIDVGPAGTAMRFLIALCAVAEGSEIVLSGTERMHCRPIGELVDALRSIGADIQYLQRDGYPPVLVKGKRGLSGGIARMNGSVSSQFFTALLLISPLLCDGLTLEVEGEQVSRSYIDMTIGGMRKFGIKVFNEDYRSYVVLGNSNYLAGDYHIEGDASGASYFWGIAAITGGSIKVLNISSDSLQGDAYFPCLLENMGCSVKKGFQAKIPWIEVEGTGRLRCIETDMVLMPDSVQTLAVIASVAEGTSRITGVQTLKYKETDRIQALSNELHNIGIRSEIGDNFINVEGGTPLKGTISTYDDHRMAMSFAMLGAKYEGIAIQKPGVVSKSFPEFWKEIEKLGVRVE
jgi:3-phosphoshikimate 1-carboxyvinyltransferase